MLFTTSYFGLDRIMRLHFISHMILAALRFLIALCVYPANYEGLSLTPFTADEDDDGKELA